MFNLVDNASQSSGADGNAEMTKEMQLTAQINEKKQENTKLKRKITNLKKHARNQKAKLDKEQKERIEQIEKIQVEIAAKSAELARIKMERDQLLVENERLQQKLAEAEKWRRMVDGFAESVSRAANSVDAQDSNEAMVAAVSNAIENHQQQNHHVDPIDPMVSVSLPQPQQLPSNNISDVSNVSNVNADAAHGGPCQVIANNAG